MQHITAVNTNHLNSIGAGPKYFTKAKVFDNELSMLLDTGSQVNLVSAAECPPEILSALAPSPFTVNAYNGSRIDILGTFQTDIWLGPIKINKTPILVTNERFKPILGTPALNQLKIDFQRKTIGNSTECTEIFQSDAAPYENYNLKTTPNRRERELYQLYTTEACVIPPNSEKIVPVKIQNDFRGYGIFMTEPTTLELQNCAIAKSVSRFARDSRLGIVRICNFSNQDIALSARKPIIKVAAVDAIGIPDKTQKLSNIQEYVKIGDVPDQQRQQIDQLLKAYSDVFADENEPLGKTDAVEFTLNTGNSAPISQQKYRTPYYLRNELKRIIDKNVENGLMTECSSPWAAPTLLVKKASGQWRLVCDYRRLNAVTTADAYPLPEITDCVNELSESKFFTTTDLRSGFHQIPTSSEAQEKLAVITDFGQYTWLRMPMGAKNCPGVFQRMMDKVFRQMPLSSLVIYLDDILLHSQTLTEHIQKLEELFQILRRNKLQIRADKTVIATNQITFCGYKIKDGVKYPNEEKVQAVRELKSPQSAKDAQMVFGLLNYHRSFIPSFAKKAAPITKTYHKQNRFQWPPDAETALQSLKKEICTAALQLQIPRLRDAKFVLETDACDSGYAGTLFVCQSAELHEKHNAKCLRPVEYMSCQFTAAQSRYYIQEKELYAGKEAMKNGPTTS